MTTDKMTDDNTTKAIAITGLGKLERFDGRSDITKFLKCIEERSALVDLGITKTYFPVFTFQSVHCSQCSLKLLYVETVTTHSTLL